MNELKYYSESEVHAVLWRYTHLEFLYTFSAKTPVDTLTNAFSFFFRKILGRFICLWHLGLQECQNLGEKKEAPFVNGSARGHEVRVRNVSLSLKNSVEFWALFENHV